jgi:predicted RNase H-like HicB family nuclease
MSIINLKQVKPTCKEFPPFLCYDIRRGGQMKYTVIIEKGRESGYVAYAPALKGCVSQGRTKAEAQKNLKEAMEAYIEALIEDGIPLPTEVGRDTIELEVAAR